MPPQPPLPPPPPAFPSPAQHPLEFVTGNADTVTVSIHYFHFSRNTPCLRPVTAAPPPPPLSSIHTHTQTIAMRLFLGGGGQGILLK